MRGWMRVGRVPEKVVSKNPVTAFGVYLVLIRRLNHLGPVAFLHTSANEGHCHAEVAIIHKGQRIGRSVPAAQYQGVGTWPLRKSHSSVPSKNRDPEDQIGEFAEGVKAFRSA